MGPKRQCQIRPVPNGRATCGHLCSRLKSRACVLKEYRRPSFGSKAEPTVPSVGCACAINHRHGKHPCGPNSHQPPASYTGIAHSPASDSKATRPVLVQRTGVICIRPAATCAQLTRPHQSQREVQKSAKMLFRSLLIECSERPRFICSSPPVD